MLLLSLFTEMHIRRASLVCNNFYNASTSRRAKRASLSEWLQHDTTLNAPYIELLSGFLPFLKTQWEAKIWRSISFKKLDFWDFTDIDLSVNWIFITSFAQSNHQPLSSKNLPSSQLNLSIIWQYLFVFDHICHHW